MEEINVTDARDSLAEVVNQVAYGHDRVALTRRGKRLAAVVPLEDLKLLEELEAKVDLDEARAALEEARSSNEPNVPWNELKKQLH